MSPKPKSRKVLAVDDHPTALRLIITSLGAMGYESALKAATGAEALAAVKTGEPEIVVLDWQLPDVDGLEICRRIRAAPPGRYVYILMLTSRDQGDAAMAFEAGADDYMTKPFRFDDLQARLATAERVLDLQAKVSEAERLAAVGALTVTLRHEINNPLTGIIGFADLALGSDDLPPVLCEALESIRSLAREIARKVERMSQIEKLTLKDYLPGKAAQMIDIEAAAPSGERP